MNIKNLPDFHGKEISSFYDPEESDTFFPTPGYSFIFHYEQIQGSLDFQDLFFIVKVDKNGDEVSRVNALSKSVSEICWK